MKNQKIRYRRNLIIITLFAVLVSSFLIFIQYSRFIRHDIEMALQDTSDIILSLYDLSDVETLIEGGKENSQEYQDLVEDMSIIARGREFPYIYFLVPSEENSKKFIFVFDLDPTSFLTIYQDAPPELLESYLTDQVIFTRDYTDMWGHFISIMAPVHDGDGQILGILGIDYDLTHIRKMKSHAWITLAFMEFLTILFFIIFSGLFSKKIVTPLEKAELKAGESEQRYQTIFNESPISLWEEDFSSLKNIFHHLKHDKGVVDLSEYLKENPDELIRWIKLVEIKDVNREAIKLLEGEDKSQFLGPLSVRPESYHVFEDELVSIWEGKIKYEREVDIMTFKGNKKNILLKLHIPSELNGNFSRVIISFIDLTQIKDMERRLRQSQKMQSIGQLAGGMAHGINNILTEIMGFSELCQEELPKEGPLYDYHGQIVKSCERAGALLSRILAFSRSGNKEKVLLDLESVIKETIDSLKNSLPATIEIREEFDLQVESIFGNRDAIHEILMNLVTNAMKTMDNRGQLILRLKKKTLFRAEKAVSKDLPPGQYTLLEVEDTGKGIGFDIEDRIFEPFFTTQKMDGPGLGLSIVYSIIEALNGYIQIESHMGKGTLFRLYFTN